jgi:hypothetical protein
MTLEMSNEGREGKERSFFEFLSIKTEQMSGEPLTTGV